MLSTIICRCPAEAGVLDLFVDGWPNQVNTNGPLAGDVDLTFQSPAFLLDAASGSIQFTKKYETIYYRKVNGVIQHLDAAKNKRIEVRLPFVWEDGKSKTTLAYAESDSFAKYFVNDQINDTAISYHGNERSVALAQRFGKTKVGIYSLLSKWNGEGHSMETVDQLSVLENFSALNSGIKNKTLGWQICRTLGKQNLICGREEHIRLGFHLDIEDSEDKFSTPLNFKGLSKELLLVIPLTKKYETSWSIIDSEFRSLDSIVYNDRFEIGRYLSRGNYAKDSVTLKKKAGNNHEWLLGYEKHNGKIKAAGTIDVLGTYFDFAGGFLLFHLDTRYKGDTISYGWRSQKGRYSYNTDLSVSQNTIDLNYDILHRGYFGIGTKDSVVEKQKYDLKIFKLGLGITKKISKDLYLKYSAIQMIPDINKQGVKEKTTGQPTGVKQNVKIRGGMLNIVSLEIQL